MYRESLSTIFEEPTACSASDAGLYVRYGRWRDGSAMVRRGIDRCGPTRAKSGRNAPDVAARAALAIFTTSSRGAGQLSAFNFAMIAAPRYAMADAKGWKWFWTLA